MEITPAYKWKRMPIMPSKEDHAKIYGDYNDILTIAVV
jgi:hypothetical protein